MITSFTHFYESNLNEWDGGGANDNWATAENWTNNVAPVPGQTLVFAGSTRLEPDNDFASGTSFNGIKFKSGAGNFDLRLYGALNLGGGGAAFNNDTSSGLMTIQAVTQEEITFTAAPTFYTKTGASSELRNIAIVGGSFDLTFDGGGDMAFDGVDMLVSGTGNIIKNGSGTLVTWGTGGVAYTGNVVVNAGVLRTRIGIGSVSDEGIEGGDILVNSGATLSGGGYHGGSITIKSGATVSPGNGATSPETIFSDRGPIPAGSAPGLFILESGSTVSIPLDGGSLSGMIAADGSTFTFTGANLTIPSVANAVTTDYWRITNAQFPTTGTFVDKAEAAEWVVDGRTLRINYNVYAGPGGYYTTITDVTP
jgi:hypothetical protein